MDTVGSLGVVVGLNPENYEAGCQKIVETTTRTTKQVQTQWTGTLSNVTVAYRDAFAAQAGYAGQVEGATRKVKAHGAAEGTAWAMLAGKSREMRSHNRVLGLYGGMIASATGLTKGLGAAMVGFGAATASGMWVFAAIEGVKLLSEILHESNSEATKWKTEQKKQVEEAQKAWNAFFDSLDARKSGALRAYEAVLDPMETRRRALDLQISEAEAKLAEAKEKADEAKRQGTEAGVHDYPVEPIQRQVDALKKQRAEVQGLIDDQRVRLQEAQKAEQAKLGEDAVKRIKGEEKTKRDRALSTAAEIAKINVDAAHTGAGEEERLWADFTKWRMDIAAKRAKGELTAKEAADLEYAELQKTLARAEDIRLAEETEKARVAMKDRQAIDKQAEDVAIRGLEEIERKQNEIRIRAKAIGDTIASSMVGALRRFVLEGARARDVLKELGRVVIDIGAKALEGLISETIASFVAERLAAKTKAISETEGNIAVASAGAAAAVASIPVVGPAMAVEAAATTMAALQGMTAPLLAVAARGYDVPWNSDPLTQLHREEMVLPREQANVIRGLAGGDGSPGGDVTNISLSVQAVDGISVARMLRANDRSILRALQKATRNRTRA